MKYTIYFNKTGYVKFISHLDLMRVFKRAFKRGNISLQFSQGYNPHPKMSFAQPLSLGYSSTCEILDIETKKEYSVEFIILSLNENLPMGIEVTNCLIREDSYKPMGSSIQEAIYKIKIYNGSFIDKNSIEEFLDQDKIVVYKRQKKKKELKEVDIKNQIRKIVITSTSEEFVEIEAKLDCGSVSNLSPDLLLQAMSNFHDINISTENVDITRISLG